MCSGLFPACQHPAPSFNCQTIFKYQTPPPTLAAKKLLKKKIHVLNLKHQKQFVLIVWVAKSLNQEEKELKPGNKVVGCNIDIEKLLATWINES